MVQCTATSKQSGERCKRHAKPGHTVCKSHGADSRTGAAHGRFNGGKYVKMPARFLEQIQAGIKDPELLSLRDDIAANDVRIGDIAARLDTGESGHIWQELREALRRFDAAKVAEDDEGELEAQDEIRDLIVSGHSDYVAWVELRAVQDHGRKLRESERKREVDMHQLLRGDKALAMISAILSAVEREVVDREKMARINVAALAIYNAPGATE